MFPFRKKHKPNTALRILLATNGIILLAGAMLGPIYALFVEEIGGDLFDASLAGAAFAIAAGVTTFVSGTIADKVRKPKHIVIAGYTIMAVGFFLFVGVSSMATLFLVQALIGIGEAIYAPAYDAMYSNHLDRGKAGREWGEWETMAYFIAAIGAIVGGWLVTTFSFDILFLIMGIISLASAMYILFLPKKSL